MTWQKFFFGLMFFVILLFYFLRKKNSTNSSTATKPDLWELRKILASSSPKGKNYADLTNFVFAQWQFESANFTSSLYIRANNASGMRIANQRKQKRTGETNGYAEYKDWQQCAEDLVLWFDARRMPTMFGSLQNYVSACKQRSYFEADENKYYLGVKRYYDEM